MSERGPTQPNFISQCCERPPFEEGTDSDNLTGRCSGCRELTVFVPGTRDDDATGGCYNRDADLDPDVDSEYCTACREGR